MSTSLKKDPYPGRPKILFIGPSESSHTNGFIHLLDGARLNVRMFGLSTGAPPGDWAVPTYVTARHSPGGSTGLRVRLYAAPRWAQLPQVAYARYLAGGAAVYEQRFLARVIRSWRPDIIHTFGIPTGSEFYFAARERFALAGLGRWVLQVRGGSDLTLPHLDPAQAPRIAQMLKACDRLMDDNWENVRIAKELGFDERKLATSAPIPGAGGLDLEHMATLRRDPPSSRRVILWPKAYECPYSKSLPVLEALKICWESLRPCRIHMLAADVETRSWFRTLPAGLQEICRLEPRIPHAQALELMGEARVMLAPTLIDGFPNSLLEAMATGALPIVSPLANIASEVEGGRHVLFARNLYPQEIADALVRAMTDDALIEAAAIANLEKVRILGDRKRFAPLLVAFYEEISHSHI